MRYNAEELKDYIKNATTKIYHSMGLEPGKQYTATELQEAYGKYLLEADDPSGFNWLLKRDEKSGAVKFYGIKANGDGQLEVQKGMVGSGAGESKFKNLPKGAMKQAGNIVKWKTEKEGWVPVDFLPEDEETAYGMYGDKLSPGVSYDDIVMQRGEAELAKRAKEEAERSERKKMASPRGLQDAEGNSDRKIYGKRDGFPLHTGLKGHRYYPKDAEGKPFQSKFKANQMVKMKSEPKPDGSPFGVKISGRIPSNPADKNSEPVDHTQNWHTNESKFFAKINDMIAEHILKISSK